MDRVAFLLHKSFNVKEIHQTEFKKYADLMAIIVPRFNKIQVNVKINVKVITMNP